MPYKHNTSMLNKSVELLNCHPGEIIVDGTLGGFGHANLICDKIGPNGILVGIDQDIDAINNAKKMAKNKKLKIHIKHENFINLFELLYELRIPSVDGILIDAGISLNQIQSSGRGFSFSKDEPLDMRMDTRSKITAATILATMNEKEIANIFKKYGEERWSDKIAYNLVKYRKNSPILTSKQLSCLVKKSIPKNFSKHRKIHPATRVFMALRIAVNKELEILEKFLKKAIKILNSSGRICVLSFHSLEDRIVKKTFRNFEYPCTCPSDFPVCVCNLKPVAFSITKKVITPSKEEIKKNPNSRSTKLRAVQKCN